MTKRVKKVLCIMFFVLSCMTAYSQEEVSQNDILYSQEYFDYLIECASRVYDDKKEEIKEEIKEEFAHEVKSEPSFNQDNEVALDDDTGAFYLKIETFDISKYKESVKKEDSKTTIQINDKFNVVQDTLKSKNKYNTNDYRLKAGVEFLLFKKFVLSSGLETNLRGLDQNPISKKFYFNPTIKFSDKFSISFINKMNTSTKATDHDISLNLSPFKSKSVDFNVYTSYTRTNSGASSESINFRTNFYLF